MTARNSKAIVEKTYGTQDGVDITLTQKPDHVLLVLVHSPRESKGNTHEPRTTIVIHLRQ
jgi:hypothetical protein